jgi:hypothetical protein
MNSYQAHHRLCATFWTPAEAAFSRPFGQKFSAPNAFNSTVDCSVAPTARQPSQSTPLRFSPG